VGAAKKTSDRERRTSDMAELSSNRRQPEMSRTSARQLASRCLPTGIKRALKSGPAGAIVRAIDRLNARVTTRRLDRDRVFRQPLEHARAAASMSIVVPIHDAPQVTERCLRSLENYAAQAEVILVDDASKMPKTLEIIREFSARNPWKVVANSSATGHSKATAAGAAWASRPYLCLLNSDTVVTPWCWHPIEEAFEGDPRVGVAGPSTSRSATRQARRVAGDCRFEWNDNQICGYADWLRKAPLLRASLDLPWIGGFALFIRTNLWRQLGGFDQNLADYGNEIELCQRVTRSGFRAVFLRRAYIHHFAAQSYSQLMAGHEIRQRMSAGLQYAREK